MTKTLPDLDSYPTATALAAAVIEDNGNWNNAGISEKDIAVCLQMSRICEWGSAYRASMLSEALVALPPAQFKKRGERWFHVGARRLETFTRSLPVARTCEGPLCRKDITGKGPAPASARRNARRRREGGVSPWDLARFCLAKSLVRALRATPIPRGPLLPPRNSKRGT
jgi:hypothetical protein